MDAFAGLLFQPTIPSLAPSSTFTSRLVPKVSTEQRSLKGFQTFFFAKSFEISFTGISVAKLTRFCSSHLEHPLSQ